MVRGTELSEDEKAQIKILIAAGLSNCKIAGLVQRSEFCVRAFRKKENAPQKVSRRGLKRSVLTVLCGWSAELRAIRSHPALS